MVVDIDLPAARQMAVLCVLLSFCGVGCYHIVIGVGEALIRRYFGFGPDWLERERYHDERYDRLEALIRDTLAATQAEGVGGQGGALHERAIGAPLGNHGEIIR